MSKRCVADGSSITDRTNTATHHETNHKFLTAKATVLVDASGDSSILSTDSRAEAVGVLAFAWSFVGTVSRFLGRLKLLTEYDAMSLSRGRASEFLNRSIWLSWVSERLCEAPMVPRCGGGNDKARKRSRLLAMA